MEIEPEAKRQRVNLNQGMRRLAIFAGVLGAVAGGFYAHKNLRNVLSERYQHRVFEKLAASEIVKQERALLLSLSANGATFAWPLTTQLSDPWAIASVEPLPATPPPKSLPKDFNGWDKPKVSGEKPPAQSPANDSPIDYETEAKKFGLTYTPPKAMHPIATNGIKTIFWKPDFSVDFFEMQDGGYVNSGPSPSAWSYLLWVAFPMLGFFIMWGAIRGVGWVAAGFFQTPK